MKQHLSLCSAVFSAALIVLPACVFAQAAPAADPAPAAPPAAAPAADTAAPPADALPGHFAEERHTSTSEVMAIDAATRMITLKEEGEAEPQTYEVGKEVRNLDQVKPGDRVKVDYFESTSIKVLPPGEVVNEDAATLARSQPGEKPGGLATRKRTMTTTVSSVFPDSKEFLTRNEQGRLRTWKVKDAKDLESIHSGDRVQLTYTSALAVSVTPAPKATTTTTPPPSAGAEKAAPAPAPAPAPAAEPAKP